MTVDYMDSLCKDHFLQRQYRKLDGGVLWSRNERNLDCTVTFQTHSILQRFMLHFEMLQLDCNDHLFVYDGAHATAPPKADLSCRNTKQQVGALFTRSNFVTLKYVTDNWGTDANGFKLVITAVKDPSFAYTKTNRTCGVQLQIRHAQIVQRTIVQEAEKILFSFDSANAQEHGCKEFRCKQREFCVSADLMCDGVDHCADGSDEDTAALCPGEFLSELGAKNEKDEQQSGGSGGNSTWIAIVVGAAALLALVVLLTLCCYCRSRAPTRRTHLHLQQMASSNGAGGGGKQCNPAASPATRLPGNWAHPAGPRGYRAARPGRLRARAQR
nr:uncharacterized protein LOC117988686 [Maniola hyperantus]